MNNITLKKTITGAILFLGIYYLLSVVPKNKLDDRDVLIISLVLFVGYLLYDNLILSKKEKLDPAISNENSNQVPVPIVPVLPYDTPQTTPQTTTESVPEPMKVETLPTLPTLPKVEECTTCKVDIKDNTDVKKISSDEGNLAHSFQPLRKHPSTGSRMEDGILSSEMPYTDYNSLPIGANVDSKVDDFSYTFLPPDKWYPVPPHPPVCIAEKQCPVCPVTTTGALANLKEWGEASRVTPGDQVNTTYLNEKLNSGR
jgi:ferredoxin